MNEAIIFLTKGFEEIEAVAVIDILRRGGIKTASVSLTGEKKIVGSHEIILHADFVFDEIKFSHEEIFILPGGPGTSTYKNHGAFLELLKKHDSLGGKIAAICAAPTILGELGLLAQKTAVCYPTLEKNLHAKKISDASTITDANITTSKCPASSIEFALEILRIKKGDAEAKRVANAMCV
ncbi:MAG: DJ-1/PfpI family protein [Defluviitaleaceae bacterium]|nr:DJ-1/PfpI family protein [Defluviitaleaceae bacterium]